MKIIPSCLLVAALAASACTYEEAALPPPQETEPPFVPVGPDGEVMEDESSGAIDGSTFYVAIHRSAFDRRWFFTTTLSQLEPDGPTGGAARSLGVRVVRLVEQNHRLFLMDDTAGDGSVLTPPRIVDDFPIVDHVPSGGGNYVMVDFARGRADFRITALGADQAPADARARGAPRPSPVWTLRSGRGRHPRRRVVERGPGVSADRGRTRRRRRLDRRRRQEPDRVRHRR